MQSNTSLSFHSFQSTVPVANLSIEHQREAGADGSAFLTAYDKWSPQSSFVPLVFLGFAVFHFNPAMPQNLPHCTILNRKQQTVVEFSCYHHDSPQNACQHLFDSSTHTRIFLQCHFSPLVDLINSATEKLHIFHLYLSGKKQSVYLPQLSLPQLLPPLSSPQLCLLCFCNALQCTGRCFGCSRLDCYTDQQRASACFLLFDMSSTPPQTNILYTQTQCASKADSFLHCRAGRWRTGRTHKYEI